jgi:hypothetical protein
LSQSIERGCGGALSALIDVLKLNILLNLPRKNAMEQQYKDWIALLKRTNNEDLLNDPYNVWIEAWTLATSFAQQKDPTEVGQKHTST